MNKKKCLLTFISSIASITVLSVVLINGNAFKTFAEDDASDVVWGHYDAVESKTARAGSKEYWISCSTHEILFEAPTIYKEIIDRGEPQGSFNSSDSRYIAPVGSVPELINGNTQVKYGICPQTVLEDDGEIYDALDKLSPESNGYYIYNGEYYAKTIGSVYNGNNYVFSNGNTIVNDETYWFKVEPIIWKVLPDDGDHYYLLSTIPVDTHRFNEKFTGPVDGLYCNNYEHSEIRSWINNEFYNTAFTNNSFILTTEVDNSASTTDSVNNAYVCDNTFDKVFLLSYRDYINESYGFPSTNISTSNPARYMTATDWVRARGATCTENSSYSCAYWSRSPRNGGPTSTWNTTDFGTLSIMQTGNDNRCVRPAIKITIA